MSFPGAFELGLKRSRVVDPRDEGGVGKGATVIVTTHHNRPLLAGPSQPLGDRGGVRRRRFGRLVAGAGILARCR